MDWYSPGRPIIGLYCESDKYQVLEKLAYENCKKEDGLIIFVKSAQELYGIDYKKYEYEIMEIFQTAVEIMYIRKEGVFSQK